MKEETIKKEIIERVRNAKTKAELSAIKETMTSALLQSEAESILAIRKAKNEKMAFLNAITSERHDEISEENRQRWKQDRERMWLEVNTSVTAPTLAEILDAALVRGIIESYTVNVSNGEVLEGSRK